MGSDALHLRLRTITSGGGEVVGDASPIAMSPYMASWWVLPTLPFGAPPRRGGGNSRINKGRWGARAKAGGFSQSSASWEGGRGGWYP